MALEGGVLYIESDSSLNSKFDRYEFNRATKNGGVIYLTTRSIFYIVNSKFVSN